MILQDQDFRLLAWSRRLRGVQRALADLETDVVARRLAGTRIERPVFIAGLARAGTTILLTLLSRADGVATHRYSDFPFLEIPFLWNWFQARFARPQAPRERAHGDRIQVTVDSPEAYEEPIWQAHFPWLHDPGRTHVLDESLEASAFEADFATHLRKILVLRRGRRYLSKGNYNLTRVRYLAKLFEDAHFLLPVRAPLPHVHSLVKQHRRFCGFAAQDSRIPAYLRAAGHYEFGPQRVPVNVRPEDVGQVEAAWSQGGDYRGYARQWAVLYRYVDELRALPGLTGRLTVVRYEDLCAAPLRLVGELLAATGLTDAAGDVRAAAETVAAPPEALQWIAPADRAAVCEEVAGVAPRFGYAVGEAG